MKFIGAFIAGILFTFFVGYIVNIQLESKYSKEKIKEKIQIQYVEVEGKNGNTKLHTGMSKDSVKILVGKPDEVELYSVQNNRFEKWGYKIHNDYISDLNINFENGKLDGVRQD